MFKNITSYLIPAIIVLLVGSNLISFTVSKRADTLQYIERLSDSERLVIINSADVFTDEKFITYLKELNVKYPHIIYAQAKLETANFSSKVFRENNNLFGMKCATSRATTNKGEQYNHAVFDTWRESVLDYAFYQSRYLSDIKTEEQYYEYLSNSYAEDTGYIGKLRTIVSRDGLKEKFNDVKLSYR